MVITAIEVVLAVHHRRRCFVHVGVGWFHTAKLVDQRRHHCRSAKQPAAQRNSGLWPLGVGTTLEAVDHPQVHLDGGRLTYWVRGQELAEMFNCNRLSRWIGLRVEVI